MKMNVHKLREIRSKRILISEKVVNKGKMSIQSWRETILTFNNPILKTQKQKRSRRSTNHKIVYRDYWPKMIPSNSLTWKIYNTMISKSKTVIIQSMKTTFFSGDNTLIHQLNKIILAANAVICCQYLNRMTE